MHIALVNDHSTIEPEDRTPYIRQILTEDGYLIDAFSTLKAETTRVDWADTSIGWSQFDAILIRQTWDYFEQYDEFTAWLNRVEQQTRVVNPVPVMRWNADKRYLVELAEAGVATVPTQVFERSPTAPDLAGLMDQQDYTAAVIKPAVSGAGRETWRIARSQAEQQQSRWQSLLAQEDMLLQPFMPDILESGEVSLVVIGGEVTHAVHKIAAPGEFRVQDDHGGSVHPHQPTRAEIALAEQAISAVSGEVAYARVDLVESPLGPQVMELELIEPELFFRNAPLAAQRLAEAVFSAD
ncbi:MAG: hypothetical protein AAF446_10800 [Pseudomonadota bacterium]